MSLRLFRTRRLLSQEQLAELTGLSLRTIQRAESGEQISKSSKRALAAFFDVDPEQLDSDESHGDGLSAIKNTGLVEHRAGQLIIFSATFFVFALNWIAYYYRLKPGMENASLFDILGILFQIALVLAAFVYTFHAARRIFVWSYYVTAAAFLLVAIGLGFWTGGLDDNTSSRLLFPVYYTCMTIVLLLFHVVQLALSLQGESRYSLEEGSV